MYNLWKSSNFYSNRNEIPKHLKKHSCHIAREEILPTSMVQPIIRLPFTEQASSCGICGGQCGSGKGFFQNSALLCRGKSVAVQYQHFAYDTTAPQNNWEHC
jgi:hypothetical protein